MCRCWQWTEKEVRASAEQVETALHLYAVYSKSMSAKGAMHLALDAALNVRRRNASKVEVIDRSKLEPSTSNVEAFDSSKFETSGLQESGQAQIADSAESLLSTSCTA